MHTVIITDSRTSALFDEYRRVFAPFLVGRGGSICQCVWNENSYEIETAVSKLYESIRGHPEWRAIILINPQQSEQITFNLHNPFDFECNRGKEIQIEENHAPLVRLTHMLAGFPSLGVKGYELGYECSYLDLCKDIKNCEIKRNKYYISHKDFHGMNKERIKEINELCSSNLKQCLKEIKYSDDDLKEYERLQKKYILNENRPVEILLISTREIFEIDDRERTVDEVRRAWEFYDEEESSDFWKIYPNNCRFLCYDMKNVKHTLYRMELLKLFLAALTMAINQIPGPVLQAYMLYKTNLNIDTKIFESVYDAQIEKLLSLQIVIQERMQRVPELTHTKKTEIVPTQYISVKFENVDESRVQADYKELGLASDCPVCETKFWYNYVQETKQIVENIMSAPHEIVVNKALETRAKAFDFSNRAHVMDRFQIERVNRRAEELEPQIINASIYNLLNTDETICEAEKKMRKHMGLRLTKSRIILISVCSLAVYLCGYIPYLINSAKISLSAFGASFGLAVIALVLLAAGGFLVIWFLRHRLIKKIKEYNKTIRDIFNNINRSGKIFSDYFSSVCTYMYARSLLSGIILKHDTGHKEKKILKAHLVSIEQELEKIRELYLLFKIPNKETSMLNDYVDIPDCVLSDMPHESHLYELAPYKLKNTVDLDNTGETLDAPYSFVKGMSFKREEIYIKTASKKESEDA